MGSEWIEHDGKGAPDLPPGTRVQVRFRDGVQGASVPWEAWHHEDPKWSNWVHDDENPLGTIVAYRVVRNEQ